MKKLTCLLLSLLIFVSPILAQNPCEDSTYLELKLKTLDDLSDREYEYFTRKDTECSAYLSKSQDKPQNDNKAKSSATIDDLTEEQKKIYLREKLNIELSTQTFGSARTSPSLSGNSLNTSLIYKIRCHLFNITQRNWC